METPSNPSSTPPFFPHLPNPLHQNDSKLKATDLVKKLNVETKESNKAQSLLRTQTKEFKSQKNNIKELEKENSNLKTLAVRTAEEIVELKKENGALEAQVTEGKEAFERAMGGASGLVNGQEATNLLLRRETYPRANQEKGNVETSSSFGRGGRRNVERVPLDSLGGGVKELPDGWVEGRRDKRKEEESMDDTTSKNDRKDENTDRKESVESYMSGKLF
jgi:hypothetical protein